MIKKLFEFTGDVFLMFLLMGIILTSVFGVISLSPLTAERLGYSKEKDSGVLGIQSSEKKLIFTENVEQNQYFTVDTENSVNFVQNIKIGPMSAEKYKKQIFTVENPDENTRNFKITMKIAPENSTIANIGIQYFNEDYILLNSNGDENVFNGTISPKSTGDFYFLIDPQLNINYPIDIQVMVEETVQTFEYPN